MLDRNLRKGGTNGQENLFTRADYQASSTYSVNHALLKYRHFLTSMFCFVIFPVKHLNTDKHQWINADKYGQIDGQID